MGNDASLPEEPSNALKKPQTSTKTGVPSFVVNGDGAAGTSDNKLLPPMVLIIDAVLQAGSDDQMFYAALLDGCEVGRAASYPSPSVRVAPCTVASVVTLQFFAGADAEGFLMRKMVDIRMVGEVRVPISTIVKYGAPLYTSIWLGLPGDEATPGTSIDLKQALAHARIPTVPKVRVTIFKPARETLLFTPTSRLNNSLSPRENTAPPTPQPDIQAVFANMVRDEGGLDLCLGPTAHVQPRDIISKEEQVRGLVEALKIANETASAWQTAIFWPMDDMELARRAREEPTRRRGEREMGRKAGLPPLLPPFFSDKDCSSVVSAGRHEGSSVVSSGRLELERQLATATQEVERLRGVEEQQQALQSMLDRTRSDLQTFRATESQHIEDLQKRLISCSSENEALQAFRNEVGQDYEKTTQKLEIVMQENMNLKQDQQESLMQQRLHLASSVTQISNEDHAQIMQKLEIVTQENIELKREQQEIGRELQQENMKLKREQQENILQQRLAMANSAKQISSEEHYQLKIKHQVLKDEMDRTRREHEQSLEREAALTARCEDDVLRSQDSLRVKFEMESMWKEKEEALNRERLLQAEFKHLERENTELMQLEVDRRNKEDVPMEHYRALQDQLNLVEQDRKGLQARLENEERLREEKLAQVDEERRKMREHADVLAGRLQELDLAEKTASQAPPPEPAGVPMEEYERVTMKYKEVEQDRDLLRARLEDLSQRLRDFEQQAQQAQQESASGANGSVSSEKYEALQRQLEQLETVLDVATMNGQYQGVPFREHEALQQKLAQVEEEKQGYIELQRDRDRWKSDDQQEKVRQLEDARQQASSVARERDEVKAQLVSYLSEISHLRSSSEGQQQEINLLHAELQKTSMAGSVDANETAEAVAAAVARAQEHFSERESMMKRDIEALKKHQGSLVAQLEERKRESQVLTPPSSRSLMSNSNLGLSRQASEDIVFREGEKTMMGAKVSEMRLAMTKNKQAHKEDISKMNKELMTARALSNQERQRRADLEQQVESLDKQAQATEERHRAEASRLEEMSLGDQDAQMELSRLKGEIEVLRIRERQWQAIATGNSEAGGGSFESASSGPGMMANKADSFVLRLFHRLLWEKFSHMEPDDLQKALKMDQRPATIPKSDVDKVIKSYRAHQKNFTIAKAFRGLDLHRNGRLAPHEFELRLTQILSLDVELSGHVYNLLHSALHVDGAASGSPNESRDASGISAITPKGESDAPPYSARSASSRTPPTSSRSLRPPLSGRGGLDSTRCMEEGSICEEEFATFFELRKT